MGSTAQWAGSLVGLAIVAAMTSNDKNPAPVEFVPMDESAARTALTELRQETPAAPPLPSRDR